MRSASRATPGSNMSSPATGCTPSEVACLLLWVYTLFQGIVVQLYKTESPSVR